MNNFSDPTLGNDINLNHMELFIHLTIDLTLDKEMFKFGVTVGDYPPYLSMALKAGLEAPYLLHQMLAFSARHLAYLHPERSGPYLHQAVTLQTRAISLFNAAWTDVNQSNCVAMLLYSSILGHHLLADALAKRDPSGGLDAFLAHYTGCLEMLRGIYVIARIAWPLLMESDLQPILAWSSGFTSRLPRGSHCREIREMVDNADGLEADDKEACRLAIDYLQIGFDALSAEEEEKGHRYQMIFSWSMLASPCFTSLLAAKRPEALVLLGYYAVLLHYGRKIWQVLDAGAYILGLVGDHLGSEWDVWLEYPRQIIARAPGEAL